MPEPSNKPKPGIIWNPPTEGRGDEATLIAVLAHIIARTCAVPAPEPQPTPAKERKRARGE